jgi:hypothetical protein
MKQKKLPIYFYVPKTLIVIFLITIGTISIFFGCATIEEPHYASQPDVIDVVPAQTFDLATLLTGNNRPSIDVQLARPGEVSRVYPENSGQGAFHYLIAGIILVPAAMLFEPATYFMPLTDSAIVAAGAVTIFVIYGAVKGAKNSNAQPIVVKAFEETNFPAQIQYILEKNLSSRFSGQPDGITEIQFLILDYGFTTKGSDNLEFHFEADIQVKHAGELVFQDLIFWSSQKRSEDVPPPKSASLYEFAQDDGKLMRTVLEEYGEVVAAIVLKRLKVPYEAGLYHYNIPDDRYLPGVQREGSGSANQ